MHGDRVEFKNNTNYNKIKEDSQFSGRISGVFVIE